VTHEAVRTATAADLPRVADLLTGALASLQSTPPGSRLPPGSATAPPELAPWVDDRRRLLLVGEFHGAVVGTAAGSLPDEPGTAETVGAVDWCYVEHGAREVGVGTALLEALARWFTDAGCRHMEGLALPGDRATKQLYEHAGMKARLLVMHRPLP
jgi:GNAT superfamily N-acetyltransferase